MHKIITVLAKINIVIAFTALFYSCIDKDYDMKKISNGIEYDPSLAIPIGTVTVNLQELLDQYDSSKYINVDNLGRFYIVYAKNIPSILGENAIIFSGQSTPQFTLPVPAGIFPASGTITDDTSFQFIFSFNSDQKIDSLFLKQMDLNINIHSTLTHAAQLTVAMPGVVKDGQPFSDVFNMDASGNYTANRAEDVSGYTLKFTTPVQWGSSKTPINVKLSLSGSQFATFNSGTITLSISTPDLKFFIVYGYVGQYQIIKNIDSLSLTILNNPLAKNIEWGNPQLKISIANSYGLPIDFTQQMMLLVNNQPPYTLNIDPSINPYHIKYSILPHTVIKDSVVYTNSNSDNVYTRLQNAPRNVSYTFIATTNPQKDTTLYNVVSDTSNLNARMGFTLPIYFRSSGFGTTDTLTFDLSKMSTDSSFSIESLMIRMDVQNKLPVDIALQGYFTDSTYAVLTSMFKTSDTIVKAGTIDSNGRISTIGTKITNITFNRAQLDSLKRTKKILLQTHVVTAGYNPNKTYVWFYSDYWLKVKLSCQIQPLIRSHF